MAKYELFPHPSEQGIRGIGSTMAEAFEQVAKAMESIMVDLEKIEPKKERKIEIDYKDKEELLIEWLTELLYLFDVEEMVFNDFHVTMEKGKLRATAKGEKFTPEKHGSGTVIKAATYNELKVEKQNDKYIAQCIVDV